MQLSRTRAAVLLTAPLCVVLALALACGEPPRPVSKAPPSGQPALPPNHPPMDHPPMDRSAQRPAQPPGPPRQGSFEGAIVLEGELAGADEGAVMVSVMDLGGRVPSYSVRIPLSDERVERGEDRTVIPFALDERNAIMGGSLPPGDLQLSAVWYKDQGMVGNERGASMIVPVEPGASGLEVVLEAE